MFRTWLSILLWFSATSFFHGYAMIIGIYFIVTLVSPASSVLVFSLLLAVYLAHVFFSRAEHTGRSTWPKFIRSFVTKAAIEYFGATTVGEEALESIKGERCLFGLHPHGIYPMAGILTYAGSSPLLAKHSWLRVRPCAASILFKIPFIREYLIWTGHLDAGRRTLSKHMSKGVDDIGLVLGGEKEALATRNGREAIVLLGRTGFVEMACRYGYHLVPTYAFGQNEIFTVNTTLFAGVRAAMQRSLKISIPIFWGRGGGPMPHRVKLLLAIGNPIKVPKPSKVDKPSPEIVERLHGEYVREMRLLFERHKDAAGYPDRTLEVLAAR
mmetsp:Transcript_19261/g.32212  ORF Transcript_19261/g.32212 Transcript_19261/m.32212 type:complete len:326 (+) Transcript_19261:106-1083(+)